MFRCCQKWYAVAKYVCMLPETEMYQRVLPSPQFFHHRSFCYLPALVVYWCRLTLTRTPIVIIKVF